MRRAKACSTGAEIPCALGTFTPKYAIFARTLGSASLFISRRIAALVHFPSLGRTTLCLECFVGIEEDCDRPLIHQLHGHHRLKDSRRHVDSKSPQRRRKFFVQRLGFFRRSGTNEARPALSARVAIQRKLG